jgi:hypothetical protein
MPQARRPRREPLGRRRQPRGQHGSIQPGAGADLLRGPHPAPRLGAIPAQQIRNGGDRVAVAPLGECSSPQQVGHHGHDDLVQPPRDTFADGEHGKQIVGVRGRSARCGQLVNSLGQAAMR